ncbi:MAG TPA: glycerol kinase GlpK [Opitutaceae bacterium]|nr:glycerol kinase GlpK [Opitutaceae bacterium]
MTVLAIDQSTSATKALLFDSSGQCLDHESREHRQYYPRPGWVEHDAEEIWQNALSTLRAVIERHTARLGEIACLSLTNQRETVVVFDRATGKPLHPAIVWQCRRSDSLCAQHAAAGLGPLIQRKTGLLLDAYFSASKLQWLVREHPETARRLADGSALIGTIDTYLIYRLTRGAVFATDVTNASRTLLFDLSRRDWDDGLCAIWEVPRRALAEIRDCDATFGETTLDGALPRPLPIRGVLGDSQASLFAQRCFTPGSAKITFGTGTSVLLNVGAAPKFSSNGIASAVAWQLGGEPTYAFEGIIISSAATLTWLRDQLGFVREIGELETLASSVTDNGGVYLVPAFSGLGLPHWQPAARAAITGLSGQSDRRHVARAALESIAYQIRDVLDALRIEASLPLAEIRADGGPTANRLLMQFTADLTRTHLRVSAMAHGSALGAALAGLLGSGVFQSVRELASIQREEIVYVPTMPVAQADMLHAGWKRAVRSVLPPA